MPTFSANGVNLYYEETGQGFPLVWSHEFAGNYPSWDPQVRFFSRRSLKDLSRLMAGNRRY